MQEDDPGLEGEVEEEKEEQEEREEQKTRKNSKEGVKEEVEAKEEPKEQRRGDNEGKKGLEPTYGCGSKHEKGKKGQEKSGEFGFKRTSKAYIWKQYGRRRIREEKKTRK